jgi:SAM-dependent methyltransferase
MDMHAGYLARARAWASREGLAVALRQGDIAEPVFAEEFDAVLCLFNSFGYFADRRQDQRVLDHACAALRPGGRFLLEAAHRDGVVRTMHVREADAPDGRCWREEPSFDLVTGVVEARWTVTSPRGSRTFVSRSRPYSATEMGDTLREAGFHDVRFHGDLAGSAPSLDAYMIVALASRLASA